MFFRLENVPAQYQDGYSKLRSWTYSSLDHYKVAVIFADLVGNPFHNLDNDDMTK